MHVQFLVKFESIEPLPQNGFIVYDEQNRIINDIYPGLNKPPYVYNGCPKRHCCRCIQYLCNPKKAQTQYEASHEDIPLTHAKFYEIDARLTSVPKMDNISTKPLGPPMQL